MIHFLCTKCKKALKAPDGTEGKTFKCNGCSEPQVVPGKIAKEEAVASREYDVIGFAQQDDMPQPPPIEIPTANRTPIQKYISYKEEPAKAGPASTILSNVGKTIYNIIMVLIGSWCIIEWVLFVQKSSYHAQFLYSKESVTMGESTYGTYALLTGATVPFVSTMIFFVLFAIGKLKTS